MANQEFEQLRQAFGHFGDLEEKKPSKKGKTVKYEINFSKDFDNVLRRLAMENGVTMGDIIARAVEKYGEIQKDLHPLNGEERHLVIRDGEEIIQRVELP
jgi:ribulose 1,5-bisphosphate carboxylase large subunit-like protein